MRDRVYVFPMGDHVDFKFLDKPDEAFIATVRELESVGSACVHEGKLRVWLKEGLSRKKKHAAVMEVFALYEAHVDRLLPSPAFRHPRKVAMVVSDCKQTLRKELDKLNPADREAAVDALTPWLQSQ